MGVVVDGRETIVHAYNPWDSLGYQAVEDFVVLFDQHAYGPAAASLEAARSVRAAAAAEPTGGAALRPPRRPPPIQPGPRTGAQNAQVAGRGLRRLGHFPPQKGANIASRTWIRTPTIWATAAPSPGSRRPVRRRSGFTSTASKN